MKKIIALVLALVMVFALCACGAEKNQKEVLYDKYEGIISSLEAEDYDGAVSAIDSLRPEPEKQPSHEVQITMDNWQDYFELKKVPSVTSFGDLDAIMFTFELKDKYKNQVDYDTPFSIDIKHADTLKGEAYFKYSSETNEVTITSYKYSSTTPPLHNTRTLTNQEFYEDKDVEDGTNMSYRTTMIYTGPVYDDVVQDYDVQIEDVKGSIYLYD